MFRSSRPEVFCKKGVLRNFTKFIGKHLCQSLFFNKVVRLKPATLLKKRPWHRCFPVNFVKFLRTPLMAASRCFKIVPGQLNNNESGFQFFVLIYFVFFAFSQSGEFPLKTGLIFLVLCNTSA